MPTASAIWSSSAGCEPGRRLQLLQDAPGPLDGLGQQVTELHVVAGPGAQPVAVRAEDQADRGVLEAGPGRDPARLPGYREDHLEVQRLVRADHVDRAVAAQLVDPVPDGGQVGGGVVVAAVALADDERQRLALAAGEAGRERAQRAVAVDRDALGLQDGHRVGQQRVVEALAPDVGVGERDAQAAVDAVQVILGEVDDLLPQRQRGRIAALQVHDPLAGTLGETRIRVELTPGGLVEGVRVGAQQPRLRRVLTHVEQLLDQHAELRAPVAYVVVPDHPVTRELQGTHDGVPHDGGAQVPDVHLLGDVG